MFRAGTLRTSPIKDLALAGQDPTHDLAETGSRRWGCESEVLGRSGSVARGSSLESSAFGEWSACVDAGSIFSSQARASPRLLSSRTLVCGLWTHCARMERGAGA